MLMEDRCTVCAKRTIVSDIVLVCFEIVLILMQEWCMVCAEYTRDSKIILDAPNGTAR